MNDLFGDCHAIQDIGPGAVWGLLVPRTLAQVSFGDCWCPGYWVPRTFDSQDNWFSEQLMFQDISEYTIETPSRQYPGQRRLKALSKNCQSAKLSLLRKAVTAAVNLIINSTEYEYRRKPFFKGSSV